MKYLIKGLHRALFSFCITLVMINYAFAYTESMDFLIQSFDGIEITANVAIPDLDPQHPDKKFPAVIFLHGWANDKNAFYVDPPRRTFAENGYIAIAYTIRGFETDRDQKKHGGVSFGGIEDINDLGACIDWLIANTPVDVNNIGVLGHSYGAGIALKAVASDERIKTVIARGVWINHKDHFYAGNTQRIEAATLLHNVGMGFEGYQISAGRERFEKFNQGVGVEETVQWLYEISPITLVDQINARESQPSIYIQKGIGDYLLHANAILKYFDRLSVPKRLYLNRTNHSTVVRDLFPEFNTSIDWFDYHLKGVNNDMMNHQLGMVVYDDNGVLLEKYTTWSLEDQEYKIFYPGPRYLFGNGSLNSEPYNNNFSNWIETTQNDSGISTGTPWVSGILWHQYNVPISALLSFTNHQQAIVYESDEFADGLKIRGIPELTMWASSDTPVEQMQLIAYLYEFDDSTGYGMLLTHAPATINYTTPGERVKVSFEFLAIAHNIRQGHGLAIAIDTKDPLFVNPPSEDYRVNFHLSSDVNQQPKLLVPFVD